MLSRGNSSDDFVDHMQWNAGESVELIRTDKKLGMDKSKVTERLTCVYTNIDGFSSTKGSELIVFIGQIDPDIVLITETKLLPEHVVTEYSVTKFIFSYGVGCRRKAPSYVSISYISGVQDVEKKIDNDACW